MGKRKNKFKILNKKVLKIFFSIPYKEIIPNKLAIPILTNNIPIVIYSIEVAVLPINFISRVALRLSQ